MVNILKINKKEIGRLLLPEKIFKLEFKKQFESVYEKLKFDNVDFNLIFNLFFVSFFLNLILFLLSYPYIYQIFSNYLNHSFLLKFLILFLSWSLLHIFTYISILFFYFSFLNSKFKKIEDEIEKDLPEFLDNLVSNLKGGLSLERSLISSVRKDQKALMQEVTLINERILMGESVTDALQKFSDRFDSPIIKRTFLLIEEGIQGGGNLTEPLSRISENLKNIYMLNDEIRANASGFAVIIKAISIIIAPLLFALAITLLTFIGNLFSLLSDSGTNVIQATGVPDEFKEYLIIFSYAMIFLITTFSSLITSSLKNEKPYDAVKYIPIYIGIGLVLYSVFSSILLGFFGNII